MVRISHGLFLAATLTCACGKSSAESPAPVPSAACSLETATVPAQPPAPLSALAPVAVAASSAVGAPVASDDTSVPPASPPPVAAERRAAAVLTALRAKDMQALAALVHPERGVRFSPYSFVDKSDVRLTREQILAAMSDGQARHWGTYDGRGDDIDLTFARYYPRFVWDTDFIKGHARPADFGENTVDNAKEFYAPDGVVVEYYLDGADPRFGGMDWRALRLVLEPKDGDYYLVGVIHAEWTI